MNKYGELAMGAGLGIIGQGIGNIMQVGQNQQLMQQQIAGQKELTLFNNEQAYKQWLRTNYDAQRRQMEKAGLNIGLMYGGGGAGGGTLQSNSGNVSGSQASNESGISNGMAMMLQAGLQKAQIENITADTEKKKAEKTEVESRTPTYAKGIEKTNSEIAKIATEMGVNVETAKKLIQEVEASKTGQRVSEANIENINAQTNKINTLTPLDAQKEKQEIKGLITRNAYLDRKERAELDNLLQDIENKRNQIKQSLNDVEIKKFAEEMKADYPSLFNVGGRAVDGIIRGISRMLGNGQDDNLKREINTK